jgi:uncharacterized protein YrrD
MDIPLHVPVHCADGPCGESTYVIVDPRTNKVTDFVIKVGKFPNTERIVPLDLIVQSEPEKIIIRCEGKDVDELKPFVVEQFLPGNTDIGMYPPTGVMIWPANAPENPQPIEVPQIDPETLAIHKGATVKAMDGDVGKVDEFLIDPVSNKITHLVMREGLLWDKREVVIPVDEIERIEDDSVYLKLDKYAVEHLPDRKLHD